MQKISIKQKITLIILGLFLSVVLLEIGLRVGGLVFLSLQEHRNRISIRQRGTYRIMCLGESTTALGGKDSYPLQLEEILDKRDIGIKFSVINKGIPRINTGSIVAQLEDNLNKHKPDMVITMMGINDREGTIAYEDIPASKTILFFKAFRTYKFVKLLWLHIKNKGKEIGIYKPRERKEINGRIDDLIQSGNYKELEKRYEKAIEINPTDDSAYIDLGWCYGDQGKYEQAEEMFKKAIELNPTDEGLYIELGWWYRDQGKYEQAEEVLKKAIEINPRNDLVYLDLGKCYRSQGKYEQAEEMFKKAITLNPRNVGSYFGLGWCYKGQGQYDQAEEIFKKALEINPGNVEMYNGLAVCYKEQGKNKLEEEYLKKTNRIRSGTYNPITRRNYQRLKEMVTQRGIRLVCVQYPVRSVELLKRMFKNKEGIIFVDNERVFKKALEQAIYEDYFVDSFGGDFGHCTKKGNRLLAKNIADIILKEYFNSNKLITK